MVSQEGGLVSWGMAHSSQQGRWDYVFNGSRFMCVNNVALALQDAHALIRSNTDNQLKTALLIDCREDCKVIREPQLRVAVKRKLATESSLVRPWNLFYRQCLAVLRQVCQLSR